MFNVVRFIACGVLLLFIAGCATQPNPPVPKEWSVTNAIPPNYGYGAHQSTPPSVNLPAPMISPYPVYPRYPAYPTNPANPVNSENSVSNRPHSAPPIVNTWTSLGRWATQHDLPQPKRLTDWPLTTYGITSLYGEMILAIGSRDATWNGKEIHLGFSPEMIDGEIFLHGLDLGKNLEPLLCEPPMSFASYRIIVLDPGHGGMNSGTISVLDQRPEKEFTLDLAKRLKPMLEQEGWTVYLTRTGDQDLSLSNRVAFAENHHADIFISLHFNSAAPDKKQNGLETYCLTPTGMPSTLTRGFADPWLESLPNNYFDDENLQLAYRIHTALLRSMGEEDRGVRRARFIGVLRNQHRPAILIEGGYLSNPAEAVRIENSEFRQHMAQTIAAALARNPQTAIQPPSLSTVEAHTNTVSQ